jgi:hypothetical protein
MAPPHHASFQIDGSVARIAQNRRVSDTSIPLPTPRAPKASFASRLFGYDVFVSFALGGPPRGS